VTGEQRGVQALNTVAELLQFTNLRGPVRYIPLRVSDMRLDIVSENTHQRIVAMFRCDEQSVTCTVGVLNRIYVLTDDGRWIGGEVGKVVDEVIRPHTLLCLILGASTAPP
jgi:hypothetical protein